MTLGPLDCSGPGLRTWPKPAAQVLSELSDLWPAFTLDGHVIRKRHWPKHRIGDDVFGLRGRVIGGCVSARWSPGQPTRCNGDVFVDHPDGRWLLLRLERKPGE